LIIYNLYVPKWSLIELIYFLITTNHLIGFGDLMPCSDLYGQSRSKCAMIMTIYVIIQVLTASILSHMCFTFLGKNRQFLKQRRHGSDSIDYTNNNNNKKISININDELVPNVLYKC